jgi:hypothetical protein
MSPCLAAKALETLVDQSKLNRFGTLQCLNRLDRDMLNITRGRRGER